jgi:UDP-N-acetylmuramyl pentapeptide phosphotransferase/UDP-N-acetylglucosamine-1-phosphate transferase
VLFRSSFAIGMTIASFAIISDLKLSLLVSILPYIFNSSIVLLIVFLARKKARVSFDDQKLSSDHRRSLITVITYHRQLTERQVVAIISLAVAFFTLLGILIQLLT